MVPWRKVGPKFRKFVPAALYGALYKTAYFEGPYCEVCIFLRNKDYIFRLSIPAVSF